MKRILLSGYYGFDNAGDEAVLAGLVKGLRTRMPASKLAIEALSIDPKKTQVMHGIEARHRMKLGSVVSAIADCDLLLSGGGSLLQDTTSPHSIFYYLGIVRLAQLMGKRTMFIAQGIGPLNLARSRRLTASVANRLDSITVRDEDSASLLREIGVSRPPIEVTADPALLMGVEPTARSISPAVALRSWQSQTGTLIEELAEAWQSAIPDLFPTAMPMHHGADEDVNDQFIAQLKHGASSPQSIRAELAPLLQVAANSPIVVGMRLHALIFAAASGTPSVALSYDPKVAAFMQQTGQEDAIYDIGEHDSIHLASILTKVWENRDSRAADLKSRLPQLLLKSQLNADIAIELLGSSSKSSS